MTDAMNEPRLRHVQCLDGRGLHRMAYWQWERENGASDRVLVCVHGLSRQGRDFDTLARAMHDDCRVVCPDVVGRGESDRLADPSAYQIPTYVADMVTLLARLDAKTVHWVGTSMGGLIGMALAALPDSPIEPARAQRRRPGDRCRRHRPHRQLRRPAADLGERGRGRRLPADDLAGLRPAQPRAVAGADAADAAPRRRALAPALRPGDRASPLRAITPAAAAAGEAALWAAYDAIRCPTLVLRGADSDVLAPATAPR